VRSLRKNLLISLLLWILISLAAWPVYAAMNFLLGYVIGEGSVIDMWTQEPKRNLISSFIEGYKASAFVAVLLGLVAAIDYQLLAHNRLTGYIAGIFVPIFCVVLAFIYHVEPMQAMTGFALAGLVLWILYKFVDIGFRIRRTG